MYLKQLSCSLAACAMIMSTFANPMKPANQPISAYEQELIKAYPKKTLRLDNTILTRIAAHRDAQSKLIADFKNEINRSSLNEVTKNSLLKRVNSLNLTTTYLQKFNDQTEEINFLELQLHDALAMLNAIQASATETHDILVNMHMLAVEASDTSHTNEQRELLNIRYIGNKHILDYIQSIYLLNGEKKLSSGDFIIQIGESRDAVNILKISIPAFDPEALSLSDTSIDTVNNARHSIEILNNDFIILNNAITATSSDITADAAAMMCLLPFVLTQDLQLYNLIQDLIVKAADSVWGDNDRALMNMEFDKLKSMIRKTQTYVSLDGPKYLGGGSLFIQIGKYSTPESTLSIKLPVTDVMSLGMDKLDIKTQMNAYQSLDAIHKIKHDFAYLN